MPNVSINPLINPITSNSYYLFVCMDPKIINIEVANPFVVANKKVTNIAKKSFSKNAPSLFVLITKRKKKKINLDRTTVYPTLFLIKNLTPPKYFPTISPRL